MVGVSRFSFGRKYCTIVSFDSGASLLEHLDSMPMVDRKINAPLMMPVSEKYKDMGTIVVGKIESGHLKKGDSFVLMPNKTSVDVAAIYSEMEEELDIALCGDNVRIRLRGIEDEDISPGFVLTSPNKPIRAVRQFEAQLAILEHKNIICAGYSAVMHIHTLAEEVVLVVSLPSLLSLFVKFSWNKALLHYFDKATGRKSKRPPQFAKKGKCSSTSLIQYLFSQFRSENCCPCRNGTTGLRGEVRRIPPVGEVHTSRRGPNHCDRQSKGIDLIIHR